MNKAVFVVGDIGNSYDGGIGPWQSALFAYPDADGNLVEMEGQEFYKSDNFGLRSMDERGDLFFQTVDGVSHNDWIDKSEIYKEYVFPHLE